MSEGRAGPETSNVGADPPGIVGRPKRMEEYERSDPTPVKPGNSGGGKGPQLKDNATSSEGQEDWR